MENIVLEIRNAKIGNPQSKNAIVEHVDIELRKKQMIGIVGESGCGKSITGLSVMGLLPRSIQVLSGGIFFKGKEISALEEREMRKICGKEISMIFQEPLRALHPLHKVGSQIEEVLKLHMDLSKQEAKQRTFELMHQVGIPAVEKRYNQYPHQLSGGLNQRIMIAMAIAANPSVLIADEPTTALDVTIQAQILRLLRSLKEEMDLSVILISHDLAVICENCDYVYVMYCGEIVEQAEVRQLFENPRHPYTKALIQAYPNPEKKAEELKSIPGAVPTVEKIPDGCRFAERCAYCTQRCVKEKPGLYQQKDRTRVRCFLYEEGLENE